jgi:ATP-dependent Lhr-like helicase
MSKRAIQDAQQRVEEWFTAKGWTPFSYQRAVWRAYRTGESGLIHAPTGTGKTLAVWLAACIDWMARHPAYSSDAPAPPLHVLWVTPLRALSSDTVRALRSSADALGLPWTIEARTGDTSSYAKKKQLDQLPTALVTTPESLSILLSYPQSKKHLGSVRLLVVDEWHELMGSKRGVQTELGLARLRRLAPEARTWGLSATLGNLEEARNTLLGPHHETDAQLISGGHDKDITIDTLLPPNVDRFPWAGHLGLEQLPLVVEEVETVDNALIFTNTRSQAERWYRAILDARPDWAGLIALHYGSLSQRQRQFVERGLAEGRLRCVVSTSTLDLGVDFTPVERVFQVGSPKGVARLLQRAGRSGHVPGATSRVTGVPSHALQLVEYAAAREAATAGDIEARRPVREPIDLLVQHLITIAIGTGFYPDDLYEEVRSTHAYRHLSRSDFDWAVSFAATGGQSLNAYDKYHRIQQYTGDLEAFQGRYVGTTDRRALRHRMSIGTIVSDPAIEVVYQNGHTVGTVEESFISRLSRGDQFNFAGKTLEFIRMKELKAVVKKVQSKPTGVVPRWLGGSLPLSTQLSNWLRQCIHDAHAGDSSAPELECIAPLLELQGRWSRIPRQDELVIERTRTREGHHLFMYPFAGRPVHEGLAALVAYRLTQAEPNTFSMSYNDYGFELLSPEPPALEHAVATGLFEYESLTEDIEASLNATELARRRFRGIARVSGLVFTGYPGQQKSLRDIQASSGLIFDVLRDHDPDNLLLRQARREVRTETLDHERLKDTLERIGTSTLHIVDTPELTPFAFPIYVDRLRQRVSSESLADRVRRVQNRLEEAASS